MSRSNLHALAIVGAIFVATGILAACAPQQSVTLECSVDDTVVFMAFGVTRWHVSGAVIVADSEDGRLVRLLQANETCREVGP